MNEIEFPVEFVLEGVPVSLQAKARSKAKWIAKVRYAAQLVVPDCFATTDKVALTIYYFPAAKSAVDVDNIIKPIMDGLRGPVYCDDKQVDRVVCQKFDQGSILDFTDPSPALIRAATGDRPVTFVRIHTNLKALE